MRRSILRSCGVLSVVACIAISMSCSSGDGAPRTYQSTQAAPKPVYTFSASSAARQQYGIVRWGLVTGPSLLAVLGYNDAGGAVRGFSFAVADASAGYDITLEMLDGTLATVVLLTDSNGIPTSAETPAGRPSLTDAQGGFVVLAFEDFLANQKDSTQTAAGAMALAPTPGIAPDGHVRRDQRTAVNDCSKVAENDTQAYQGMVSCNLLAYSFVPGLGAVLTRTTQAGGVVTNAVPGWANCIDGIKAVLGFSAAAGGPVCISSCPQGSTVTFTGGFCKGGYVCSSCGPAPGADGGTGSDSGAGEGDSGVGSGDAGGSYATTGGMPNDRHHPLVVTLGRSTTLPFVWRDVSGVAPPADLSINAGGRHIVQVSSVSGSPFARAGLDVVPLQAGERYRFEIERSSDSLRVRLLRAGGEVVQEVDVPPSQGAAATGGSVIDVVTPGSPWRSAVTWSQSPYGPYL
jgi:hypothetical protein